MRYTKEPIIIGAVHLPYYGRNNPSQSIAEIEEYVMTNVKVHYDNGIDTVYIQDENLNLGPAMPETIALMASLAKMVKMEMPDIRLGMIMQSHDGERLRLQGQTLCESRYLRERCIRRKESAQALGRRQCSTARC